LKSAFSDVRTFEQFVRALAAMCIRSDHAGVTSFVRALDLDPAEYRNLLHLFNKSKAWSTEDLTRAWVAWVMRVFGTNNKINDRYVLIADGIKAPREGRKMPAVKCLHQESESNSKPEFIMGHSYQAIGLLVQHDKQAWSVPLAARIHEGVKFSNRDKRTLHNKLGDLFREITSAMETPARKYLLADAYYACASMIKEMFKSGDDLVARVKSNVVAHLPAKPTPVAGRGRPRKYGQKLKLKELFKEKTRFKTGIVRGYDGEPIEVDYCFLDLLWRPIGRMVRFVLVRYPNRGKCIFISTDLCLDSLQVIEMYTRRFKIETSFKQSVHTIGAFDYHFWLESMERITRGSGTQHLHRASEEERTAVKEKMEAYHRFVAVGLVAQGFMQYLSTYFPLDVYSLSPWLRTNTRSGHPSEATVAQALRPALFEFLASTDDTHALKKILTCQQTSTADAAA
jgi:hypothetical protein